MSGSTMGASRTVAPPLARCRSSAARTSRPRDRAPRAPRSDRDAHPREARRPRRRRFERRSAGSHRAWRTRRRRSRGGGRRRPRGGPRTTPTPRAPASCRASAPRRFACRARHSSLFPSSPPQLAACARGDTARRGETAAHRGREARARKPRAPWARWARTARASSYGHALLPPIVKKACAASTRNPGGKILLALASQPSVSAGKFSARFTVRFSSHESCGGIRGSTDRKSVAKASCRNNISFTS